MSATLRYEEIHVFWHVNVHSTVSTPRQAAQHTLIVSLHSSSVSSQSVSPVQHGNNITIPVPIPTQHHIHQFCYPIQWIRQPQRTTATPMTSIWTKRTPQRRRVHLSKRATKPYLALQREPGLAYMNQCNQMFFIVQT